MSSRRRKLEKQKRRVDKFYMQLGNVVDELLPLDMDAANLVHSARMQLWDAMARMDRRIAAGMSAPSDG